MSRTIDRFDPATGKVVGQTEAEDAERVAERFAEARRAQVNWAARGLDARVEILRRTARLIEARVDSLADVLTADTGKPISQARNEVRATPARIDFMTTHAARQLAPETVYDEGGMLERIDHEPLGVIANISAWNYPWFVGFNVIAPALIAGNAVLYKPSELALGTGDAIAEVLAEAGVPSGVFQRVSGDGQTGAALLEQPVSGVFFTGSHATGQRIAQAVAPRLIKVQLELGGKDPAYVTEDVNVEAAAAGLADGAFYNTGQSCCAVERIYVHRDVYRPFLDAFLETVRGFRIGDPTDESTYIGPLARGPQLEVLERQVSDALSKGAELAHGTGKRMDREGYWFDPTVLVEVDHSMRVMKDESFGPIIGIMAVDDDEEAVSLMNDTDYGLTAGVFTRDRSRAERLLRRVASGSAYWNCCDRVSPRLPWSGRGNSGLGLTLSTYGLQTFAQPRGWHLRPPA